MRKVSFVIPCYKSENTIESVVHEIISTCEKTHDDYEIILVNDCSPDGLQTVINRLTNDPRVKAITFAKNFGQHAGMMAGLRASTGEYVIVLDDDGQCPVCEYPQLLGAIYNGSDVAFAGYGRQQQSYFKNLCSDLHVFVFNRITDKPKNIQMTNFIAFSRTAVNTITEYKGPYPIISGLIFRSFRNVVNVPMTERKRTYGNTTYSLRKLFELWVNAFTAFSILPLRFATFCGAIASMGGVIYAIYIIVFKGMGYETMSGWASIISVILIMGGLILLVLGICGEYIGRIFMSLNNTPQYIIKEEININND